MSHFYSFLSYSMTAIGLVQHILFYSPFCLLLLFCTDVAITDPTSAQCEHYSKVPKFSATKNFCCKLPKIEAKPPNLTLVCQNGENRIANSEDPDQTAPLGAV